jgi:hypothetical protein
MANARDEEALALRHEEHIHAYLTSLFAEALSVPPAGSTTTSSRWAAIL